MLTTNTRMITHVMIALVSDTKTAYRLIHIDNRFESFVGSLRGSIKSIDQLADRVMSSLMSQRKFGHNNENISLRLTPQRTSNIVWLNISLHQKW